MVGPWATLTFKLNLNVKKYIQGKELSTQEGRHILDSKDHPTQTCNGKHNLTSSCCPGLGITPKPTLP